VKDTDELFTGEAACKLALFVNNPDVVAVTIALFELTLELFTSAKFELDTDDTDDDGTETKLESALTEDASDVDTLEIAEDETADELTTLEALELTVETDELLTLELLTELLLTELELTELLLTELLTTELTEELTTELTAEVTAELFELLEAELFEDDDGAEETAELGLLALELTALEFAGVVPVLDGGEEDGGGVPDDGPLLDGPVGAGPLDGPDGFGPLPLAGGLSDIFNIFLSFLLLFVYISTIIAFKLK